MQGWRGGGPVGGLTGGHRGVVAARRGGVVILMGVGFLTGLQSAYRAGPSLVTQFGEASPWMVVDVGMWCTPWI